jgi:hypothetical protein
MFASWWAYRRSTRHSVAPISKHASAATWQKHELARKISILKFTSIEKGEYWCVNRQTGNIKNRIISQPAKIGYPRAKISVKNTKSRRVEELNLTIFIITRLQKSVHHPINNKEQLSGLEQQQQLSTHRHGATAAAVHT